MRDEGQGAVVWQALLRQPHGAVLVAGGEQRLGAFGIADRDDGVPLTIGTRARIGQRLALAAVRHELPRHGARDHHHRAGGCGDAGAYPPPPLQVAAHQRVVAYADEAGDELGERAGPAVAGRPRIGGKRLDGGSVVAGQRTAKGRRQAFLLRIVSIGFPVGDQRQDTAAMLATAVERGELADLLVDIGGARRCRRCNHDQVLGGLECLTDGGGEIVGGSSLVAIAEEGAEPAVAVPAGDVARHAIAFELADQPACPGLVAMAVADERPVGECGRIRRSRHRSPPLQRFQ